MSASSIRCRRMAAAGACVFLTIEVSAQESATQQEPAKAPAIAGVWRSDAGRGGTAWKFIQEDRWSMTEHTAEGHVTVHHGGTFTLDGDVYSETVVWSA